MDLQSKVDTMREGQEPITTPVMPQGQAHPPSSFTHSLPPERTPCTDTNANLFPAPTMDPPNDVISENRLSVFEASQDMRIKHLYMRRIFLLSICTEYLPSALSSASSTKEWGNERKNRQWENVIGTAALCYPTVRARLCASPRGQTVISEEPGLWLTRHHPVAKSWWAHGRNIQLFWIKDGYTRYSFTAESNTKNEYASSTDMS